MNSIRPHFIAACLMLSTIAVAAQQPTPQTRDDSISGRVVTEAGQPIAGASISLSVTGGTLGQRTSTDSEGNFKVQGLDGGIYRIFLMAPGYVTQFVNSDGPTYRPGDKVELTMTRGGVIAGNVISIAGEPVVNVLVRAVQIRDADGNPVAYSSFSQPKFTDDRGYYRFWGLRPGTYLVAAGGPGQYFGAVNPFANDAMTYAPASTRDTAAEIIVRSNQEVSVDVRYRGERGHSISGKISGMPPNFTFLPNVSLTDVQSRTEVTATSVFNLERTFQLDGISDGDYEISARAGGGPRQEFSSSSPRRISVRGADVTGLDLALEPPASVDAHVNLEADAKLNCGRRRDTALRETLIKLVRVPATEKSAKDKPADHPDVPASVASSYESAPNDKGDLQFRNLATATYRLEVRLPAAGWYLRDLSLPKPAATNQRNSIAFKPDQISVKSGEKISAVGISITEGGASLRGRLTVAEGQTAPANLRIYLVPAERESADNRLRFFEEPVGADGTFAVGNIAPGRYWLLTQPAEHIDPNNIKSARADGDFRAKLIKDAAAANKEIAFKPCERIVDYEIR